MRLRDLPLCLLLVSIWGSHFVIAKTGLAEFPALFYSVLRFLLVAVLIVPFFRLPPAMLKDLFYYALLGNVIGLGFMFWGLSHLEASTSAILANLSVPFSVLLGFILLKEKVEKKRIIGTVLALCGAGMVAGGPTQVNLIGVVLMVISAAGLAVSYIFLKRISGMSLLVIAGWGSLLSVPGLLIMSLVLESGQTEAFLSASLPAWASLVYSALAASLVANLLSAYLLRRVDVSVLVPYTLLSTVVAFIAGVIILGESTAFLKVVGACLTVAGIAVIQIAWPQLLQKLWRKTSPKALPDEGKGS